MGLREFLTFFVTGFGRDFSASLAIRLPPDVVVSEKDEYNREVNAFE